MKTANFPSLRVEPALRQAAEEVLQNGESLSSFVEDSIRAQIARRRAQNEFLARGLQARQAARESGRYVAAEAVLERLTSMLADAKASGQPIE